MIREQLIQTLQARLQGLTAAPVLRCESYSDEDEFVCVWDGTQQTEKTPYGGSEHTMEVAIEWLKKSVEDQPATACNEMYNQVIKAIHTNEQGQFDASLNGLGRMAESSYTPLVPELGLKVIGVGISLQISYTTATGNPEQAI